MPGVRRIRRTDDAAALAYLDRKPYENVFLSWGIGAQRIAAFRPRTYVYDDGAQIAGVAFLGSHVVLAAESNAVIEAFARLTVPAPERMIVAPRETVEYYWKIVEPRHAPIRLARESQPVLAVDRATLRGDSAGMTVRRARPDEWETVASNSAAMICEELEYNPRTGSAEFDGIVRNSIERGAWWVGEGDGTLCFFCSEGPYSAHTLQLQGIWTPPALRRKGYAARALFAICEALLGKHATLSLYVNDFNTPALELYAALGFKQVGEFSTLLF
jgi:uncharacterized protein